MNGEPEATEIIGSSRILRFSEGLFLEDSYVKVYHQLSLGVLFHADDPDKNLRDLHTIHSRRWFKESFKFSDLPPYVPWKLEEVDE